MVPEWVRLCLEESPSRLTRTAMRSVAHTYRGHLQEGIDEWILIKGPVDDEAMDRGGLLF